MTIICYAFFNINHSKPFETDFRLIKNISDPIKREGSQYLQGGYREGGALPAMTQVQVHMTTIDKDIGLFFNISP